jgi:NADPH-dependent 2,4-dienoyl-CoA reductase/sulfur reductase-like enzyme
MSRSYVIIGFGIAGLSAARAIREQDPDGEITILTDERASFYSRPGLAYYLTGTIPEQQLFPLNSGAASDLGIHGIYAHVEQVSPAQHSISLEGGKRLSYDRLLIATGSSALKPDIPGIDLQGVVTLDTLDDARHILKLTRRARSGVVIGGGITAVEIAEGFAANGLKTHYFMRGDRFWPRVLNEEESRLVEDGMRHEKIILHHNTSIQRVLGKRGKVQAVLTSAGENIKCQLLGVAIGIRPNVGLARTAGLAVERGVVVDEFFHTERPDIFAAGDVAQVFDPQTGDYRLDSLWWQAQHQGRIAGGNMTGLQEPYIRSTPLNVTRVGGVVTSIIGAVGQGVESDDLVSIVHGDSENWRYHADSIVVERQEGVNHLRLVVGERSLVGAIIMGDQALADAVHRLVRDRTDLGRFRQILLQSPEKSIEVLTALTQQSLQQRLAPVQ